MNNIKENQNKNQKKMKGPLKSQVFVDKKAHERSVYFSQVLYRILCTIFFSVLIYTFFFADFMQITKININGESELNKEELVNQVRQSLIGNYLNIISRNNYILILPFRIEDLLKNKFKKISGISVKKKFPDTLNIDIKERKSLLILCSDIKCYLVDENGYPYTDADFESAEIKENHLIKLIDKSNRPVTDNVNSISSDYLQYLLEIKDTLQKKSGIFIIEEYSTPTLVSQEISVTTEQGMKIFFSTQFTLANAINTLNTFLAKKDIIDGYYDQLEYIDLRSENKIFYKLKNAPENFSETSDMDSENKK